jgi:DNA-binding XRE family transcriptional regulator
MKSKSICVKVDESKAQHDDGRYPYPAIPVTGTRDPHDIALGQAIGRLREQAELTQEELADRAQISAEELRRIEAGSVDTDWGTLRRLARGMDVELPGLFRLMEELEQS